MINQKNDIEWNYLSIKLEQLKRKFVQNAEHLRLNEDSFTIEVIRNGRIKTENNPTTVWLSKKL